ncbi:hypothetical protein DRJ27_00465 [Candidatus Acetothermia bacterium]|nr:MAG: hypothetical protein DRJ27_00465 [Candidatus Acetothermia bacterium]
MVIYLPQLHSLAVREGKVVLRFKIVEVYGSAGHPGRWPGDPRSPATPCTIATGRKGKPGFAIGHGSRNAPLTAPH